MPQLQKRSSYFKRKREPGKDDSKSATGCGNYISPEIVSLVVSCLATNSCGDIFLSETYEITNLLHNVKTTKLTHS